MNLRNFHRLSVPVLIVCAFGALIVNAAAVPQFNIVKPSTTGVPGEEVRLMAFDPAGNLWVGGRWPFWGEAGLAKLSADQLQGNPLPGGGFETGAWKVWSSVQNPIPSPYLNSMKFAADGTLWLASDGGLTRFRPEATPPEEMWFTYTPANSPLIVSEVRSIAIDSQGNLWVSNTGVNGVGALFKFNPTTNQWTRITAVQHPWSVTVGNNDHVFVSMQSEPGMMEWDGSTWTLRVAEGVPQIGGMLQDMQGNVWAATDTGGLWKWNGSTWQNWPNLGGTFTITGLGKDRDGVVYVSCWYGPIYKMINDNPVVFANADNIPRSVIGRPNGDIWTSNYGGNGTVGTVRHYTAGGQLLARINTYNSGLPDYFIDRIKRDSAGNMWFASGEGGLTRMLGSNGAANAATHWRNWGNHNDLSEPYPWAGNDPMYSVLDEGNGIFWMGGNGVGRWDSNTGQFTNFWNWQNSNIDTSGVHAIVKRGGTIWVGTGGYGVLWFDGTTWNHVGLSPDFDYSSNNVKAMTVDTQNNLWVASEYGLRKFAPGNNASFTLYDTSNTPLPSGGMLDVEADPTGGIWVATYEGLARFNGSAWTIYNQANTGMPGTLVADVARRPSDGLIAIASNQGGTYPYTGGVSTFDGATWTHYTPDNSPLTHWQVVAVEFDGNGNLWASTLSEGVVQILLGPTAPPPQVLSAVSRKMHGSAGAFDIALPLTGTAGIECRTGGSGGDHQIVLTFANPVTVGAVSVASSDGLATATDTVSGGFVTVALHNVSNAQRVSLTLSNVNDGTGTGAVTLPIAFLLGDTNGNGTVNASDIGQTKSVSGQTLDGTNFRADVNLSGSINASDIGLVKSMAGTALPP